MSDDPTAIVTFGIPVAARSAAKDWERMQFLLSATLGSIYNQTNPNFRVLLAYTEMPRITVPIDDRVEFLHCGFWPRRRTHNFAVQDKQRRVISILDHLGARGGGYLMLTDSDDLISNRLVDHVLSDKHPNGYLVETGYIFRLDTSQIVPVPLRGWPRSRFDQMCGTCAVMNLSEDDCFTKELVLGSHVEWRHRFEAGGRSLQLMPFPSVVWVQQSGENLSDEYRPIEGDWMQLRASLMQKIADIGTSVAPELDREFNLSALTLRRSGFRRPPFGWAGRRV